MEGDIAVGPRAVLTWDNGRIQSLGAAFLRAKCPCEQCKLAPIKLEPGMFPGLGVERADPVGRYALQLAFSDGHSHGAYSFDLLLSFPDEA
jgi:ATP-binding protein involved in chromosome partitioning